MTMTEHGEQRLVQAAGRADAARNRVAVLAAAAGLFTTRGVAAVTMDDVAAAAGVGKGTRADGQDARHR